jgi:hypothetical protein
MTDLWLINIFYQVSDLAPTKCNHSGLLDSHLNAETETARPFERGRWAILWKKITWACGQWRAVPGYLFREPNNVQFARECPERPPLQTDSISLAAQLLGKMTSASKAAIRAEHKLIV